MSISTTNSGRVGQATMANSAPVVIASDQSAIPITGAITGTVAATLPATPAAVLVDSDQFDDQGYPYVNPNVPGADIATGDRQDQQLAVLKLLLATPGALGAIQSIVAPVTVASVGQIPLAANAAVEVAGNLQKVADTMELMLTELRVISMAITQLQQPVSDGAEMLREDFNLPLQ